MGTTGGWVAGVVLGTGNAQHNRSSTGEELVMVLIQGRTYPQELDSMYYYKLEY